MTGLRTFSGPIDVATAEHLVDMGAHSRARSQLEGAVAMHNILEREQVAYLADEVGLGKTYVALAAAALYRHFDPQFRVLVIAPKRNIQHKWHNDWRAFIRHNWKVGDLRVQGASGALGRPVVLPERLSDLAFESIVDGDRDVFARLTSFSFATHGTRDHIVSNVQRALPWLNARDFPADPRSPAMRDFVAHAYNAALPTYDLVIIDEAHNLKHGVHIRDDGTIGPSTIRNAVLAQVLGQPDVTSHPPVFADSYHPIAKRVLMLSATPIESTFRQLWNQLYLVGKHQPPHRPDFEALRGDDEAASAISAARIMVRRVNALEVNGKRLTKNIYRQTWHNGGVSEYDVELPPGDVRQRLTVALVQKKVSDLVGTKFGNSFQMGMLASFESFEQTATPRPADTDGDEPPDETAIANFDNADQGDSEVERLGVDTSVVNALALDHLEAFGREMAHPKMDALVDDLSGAWQEGRKALVFVRRIASVAELKRKLDEHYDSWLIDRLRLKVPPEVWVQIERLLPSYKRDHRERGRAVGEGPSNREDLGGSDTFFGWFFRGTGPLALRRNTSSIESGASLARALNQAGGSASTFFAQHHLAEALGCSPASVLDELTREVSAFGGPHVVVSTLKDRARPFLPRGAGRRKRFEAIQYAGLDLLRQHAASPVRAQYAQDLWQALDPTAESSADGASVDPAAELAVETFFTALRSHPELQTCLTPPTRRRVTESQRARDQYLANTLIATAARSGHSLVDLYIAFMQASGPAPLPSDDTSVSIKALDNFIESLERQRQDRDRSGAFHELQQIAQAFDIIRKLNLPNTESETFKLSEAVSSCANLLSGQQPTAGLSGRVNATAVRQFRMPGYPNVLVSTDVLQEGEDLHTFCDKVVHYGVAWTSSSMEQRTGRVDRLNSLAERRFTDIDAARRDPRGDEKIQVQIPYVPDTVERLQTRRVVERMHRFTTLMHQGVDASTKRLHLDQEMIRESWIPPTIDHELTSAFEIEAHDLSGTFRAPAVGPEAMMDWWRRITHLQRHDLTAAWLEHASMDEERYTLFSSRTIGPRVQPFTLRLASRGAFALAQCLSPVGIIGADSAAGLNAHLPDVLSRITTVPHIEDREYDVAIEGDVILGDPAADAERVHALIQRVTADADCAERALTSLDLRLEQVQHTMSRDRDDA